MNPLILKAIKSSTVIELRYKNYLRIVEPHAYGRDKDGDEILSCYQTSGGSESGVRVGWKLLKVKEAFSFHLINTIFSVRKEFKRNDKAMMYIFEQI